MTYNFQTITLREISIKLMSLWANVYKTLNWSQHIYLFTEFVCYKTILGLSR